MAAPDAAASPAVLRKAIAASAIGNATEWFDYGIYAFGVGYISPALFPGSASEATLFALGTFAVSFLIRPLGGLVWGPLGDRFGRRWVLALTIMLISAATFCIGLIPSYQAIGGWAPAILIVLRMVQGFSTGGEYGGAATFMAEYAPDDRRGFCGSFLEVGTLGGFALGALLMLGCSLALGEAAMHDWGWRLPFLVAAPLGLTGIYLRSRLAETPVFREAARSGERLRGAGRELRTLFTHHRRSLFALAGLVVALNVVNYTLLSYMPTYLAGQVGLSPDTALLVPIVGMLFMMVLLPFAGSLSDRLGRKRLWWVSLIGLFVLAVPIFHLITLSPQGAAAGFLLLGLLYVPQLATISATFPAMFPTPVRFAGFAIAYNLSTSLFGGTAPVINALLIDRTGDLLTPAYLMMASCIVGMAALCFVDETAGMSLRGTGVPGRAGPGRATRNAAVPGAQSGR